MGKLKYHLKNPISKREIRKHGKEIIPLMSIKTYKDTFADDICKGTEKEFKETLKKLDKVWL